MVRLIYVVLLLGLAAAQLRAFYAASGDVRLARAAAELAPRPGRGRRAIDDTAALARMEVLLADPELTVWGRGLARGRRVE